MVAETNWRDPTDYRYLNGLNPSELAWEFLRRNAPHLSRRFFGAPLQFLSIYVNHMHRGLAPRDWGIDGAS